MIAIRFDEGPFLVRIADLRTGRVWFEIRETEEDACALVESVFGNHDMHEIVYVPLSRDIDDMTWMKAGDWVMEVEGKVEGKSWKVSP